MEQKHPLPRLTDVYLEVLIPLSQSNQGCSVLLFKLCHVKFVLTDYFVFSYSVCKDNDFLENERKSRKKRNKGE